ncbi:hypothetical protein [Oceanobacillus manasiensis]|uniref:hypothetical protein n=1 Tax=Oceanobacillus manasiensis TaxID=586413 RepID=UPI0005A6FD20|nr:hypothetical protein [Oceanobacillus manasiensis]
MLRSIIVVLLLAVFFLTGMLYGLHKDEASTLLEPKAEQLDEPEAEVTATSDEDEEEIEETKKPASTIQMAEPSNLTQKTASVLEAGVKGFYEAIVQIMYHISQIFF